MSDPTRSLRNIISRIKQATDQAVSPKELIATGEFAVSLIVKRTRLGYGVDRQFGKKTKLKPLSAEYKKFRKGNPDLSPATSVGKSNLTLSGQMLDSVKLIRSQNGRVVFGPTGTRRPLQSSFVGNAGSTPTNLEVAGYQEKQGRPFNRVSDLEFKQVLRFYRRQFGDLLAKKKLIR